MTEPNPTSGDARAARVGRVLNEYFDRRKRNEPVTRGALFAEHPDLADDLRRHFDVLGDLRPEEDRIEGLITQGLLARSRDPDYVAELGEYKIVDVIGRGGMGVVLKAYEPSLDRIIAIKILRPDLADDDVAIERFTREAKAAAALQHVNIVTVHAVGRHRGTHFLAMEFVDGPSLADVIRQTAKPRDAQPKSPRPGEPARLEPVFPSGGSHDAECRCQRAENTSSPPPAVTSDAPFLDAAAIRHLFRQLLGGLAAAHEAGLIHRDIKPANLLLDGWPLGAASCPASEATRVKHQSRLVSSRSGPTRPGSDSSFQLKIADFGLARMTTAQTRLTIGDSVLGTAEYMSPEQACGDAELDLRTDLYSAGVVLYEMLTGCTPFGGGSPSAVIHCILHDTPADPRTANKHADPHLASLAMRLMAKRPEDRFAAAAEVIKALEAAEPVKLPERRRRLRRMVASGLLVFAVGLAGLWSLSRFRTRIDTMSAGAGTKPPIMQVWVEEGQETTILARYGSDPTPRVFRAFRPEIVSVRVPPLLDLDGNGWVAIVAALQKPLEDNNLFAYDAEGKEMWRISLSSSTQWPDCGPSAHWCCGHVLAGDLDGKLGDELVVAAIDPHGYPTRISILDPRKGEILGTFWHMGHLIGMRIQRDFFGAGHPALIAWAYHNKLDGFDAPLPGDAKPRTNRDVVTVAMVLDPADMDGLGPPLTDQEQLRDLAPARPFAYAFLNAEPPGGLNGSDGPTDGLRSDEPMAACISEIFPIGTPPARDGVACMNVTVTLPGEPGWHLFVDRNLALLKVEATGDQTRHGKLADWDGLWRPIIQDGMYLEE